MKRGLTRRLTLYFSAALLAFSVVIGGVFGFLFRRYTLELRTNDLRTHAAAIAASLSSGDAAFPISARTADAEAAAPQGETRMRRGHHRMRCGGEYGAPAEPEAAHTGTLSGYGPHTYCRRTIAAESPAPPRTVPPDEAEARQLASLLRRLNAFTGSEVWLVDRAAHTITSCGAADETVYTELPEGAETLLDAVFSGEDAAGEAFSALLDVPSVTAGAPVRDASGRITGALLMHRRLADIRAGEAAGLQILAIALLFGFLFSAALSLLLARRFIRPLARMERTAAALARGALDARSGIRRDDEIGSLAQSLDTLAAHLEASARESARLDATRRDFFASISHELRTPLTVLEGSLAVLSAGLVSDEEKKKGYLAQMEANVRQLVRLVGDLFDLARLENPDFSIEKTRIHLSDALSDAVRAARRLAAPKEIDVRYDGAPSIFMNGDYGRLRQMFLVVLENAVKFSPAGARIEVAAEAADGRWRVAVTDHGPGIAADVLPHIFDRFRTSRGADGTGLGLAIALGIARRHDITLEAQNGETAGAVFTFRGRAEETDAPPARGAAG